MPYNKQFEPTLYSEEWLRQAYVVEDRNAAQVARIIGCTRQAVLAALHKFGITVKSSSAAQKLANYWTGSGASRPRSQFKNTLHSREWLHAQALGGDSLAAIAARAGCTHPALVRAFAKEGLSALWREARQQVIVQRRIDKHGDPAARLPLDHKVTENTLRGKARRLLPPAPCLLCKASRGEINHKDRDHSNNAMSNLERICKPCHSKQHALEVRLALAVLQKLGVAVLDLHVAARSLLVTEPWIAKHELWKKSLKPGSAFFSAVDAIAGAAIAIDKGPSGLIEITQNSGGNNQPVIP